MDESMVRRAIERKREGEALPAEMWESIITAYMSGAIGDEQMSALLMAIVFRGLDLDETTALTRAMVASGTSIEYPQDLFVVDKHSSGGVSDIVSLVAVPLVAACGVPVAKLSGRALGHTGGTIDKLETIEGFNVLPSTKDFVEQVQRVGGAIAAQSEDFVPADKRIYRLRDRTGTVPSVGLIAASIVSKKIAGGAKAFVFDVKCGKAAFMQDPKAATELAKTLVAVAGRFDRRAHALVTDMNEPLGRAIGTSLEVIEAREFLRGNVADERVREGCVRIAAAMLDLAGVKDAHEAALRALITGSAYEKFCAMIAAQGGDVAAMERLAPHASVTQVRATQSGFVREIDAVALGNAARESSQIHPAAGIRVTVRTGERVASGDVLAEIHGEDAAVQHIADAFIVGEAPPPERPFVYVAI